MVRARFATGYFGAWRSPVAHLLWEQGVGGSNPLAPTSFGPAAGGGAGYRAVPRGSVAGRSRPREPSSRALPVSASRL